MGDTALSTPPGIPGMVKRGQVGLDPLKQPLSPEQMYRQLVQSQRGFTSSASGAGDGHRAQPATLPSDAFTPGAKGAPVGKGYETYGALQVLDENGHRVAIAAEPFDGTGADGHAEARSIRALESRGPARVENGRLIVVVDQEICPSCRARLVAYAERKGIATIEAHIPVRESMVRSGSMVSPKTASRSAMQAGRPALVLRADEPIAVRKVGGPRGELHGGGVRARTAIVGALANLGAGLLVDLLQATFRDQMLKSLASMPKPKVDRRAAEEYFRDPNVKSAMRTLDLFNRDLKPFVRDLQARSDAIGGQVVQETVLLTVLPLSAEEAQAYAAGLDEQLGIYESDLLVVQDNLNAAMAIEPDAMAAAKSAQELFALIDTRLAEELMFRNGFAIEDIAGIRDNLGSFQRRVQSAFAEVRAASAAVDAMVAQARDTHHAANKLYWQLTRDLLVARMKAQGIQP